MSVMKISVIQNKNHHFFNYRYLKIFDVKEINN